MVISRIFIGGLIAALVLYLPLLHQPQMWHEESRRALIAETMLEEKSFMVPVFKEQVYAAKPPGYNWLIIAVSAPLGEINEFTLRLASMLCLLALLALMLVLLRDRMDGPALTFLGAAIVLAPEMMRKATLGEIDMLFTLLVSASVWIWFYLDLRERTPPKTINSAIKWLLPGIIIALAFLTKREPAFAFYYLGLGAFLLYRKRFMELFHPAHLLAAALTVTIVGLWVWRMLVAADAETLLRSSLHEVVGRGVGGDLPSMLLHLVTWPLEIGLALFPFSLALLLFLHRETRQAAFQQHEKLLTFALITAGVNFVFYWLAPQAAVRYYLPMMPSLLVVCALLYSVARKTAPHWLLFMARGLAVLLVLLAGGLLAYLQLENLGVRELLPAVMPEALAIALAVVAFAASLLLLGLLFRGEASPGMRFAESGGQEDRKLKWWHDKNSLILISFCAVMLLYRIVHYDLLLPRQLQAFREERPVKQFVADIYARVPQADLPIGSSPGIPHEIWWYMEYGDVTTSPRPYRLAFESQLMIEANPEMNETPIVRMNWRGKRIVLTRSASIKKDAAAKEGSGI